eukprot:PhF_6_TR37117/c0_g1_i1/m.54549
MSRPHDLDDSSSDDEKFPSPQRLDNTVNTTPGRTSAPRPNAIDTSDDSIIMKECLNCSRLNAELKAVAQEAIGYRTDLERVNGELSDLRKEHAHVLQQNEQMSKTMGTLWNKVTHGTDEKPERSRSPMAALMGRSKHADPVPLDTTDILATNASLTRDVAELKAQIMNLQKEHDKYVSEHHTTDAETSQLQKRVIAAETDKQALMQSAALQRKTPTTTPRATDTELPQLRMKVETLNHELNALREKEKDLESAVEELNSKLEAEKSCVEFHLATITQKDEELAELNEAVQLLESQLRDAMQSPKNNNNTSATDTEPLLKEIDSLKAMLSQSQSEHDVVIKIRDDEIMRLENELRAKESNHLQSLDSLKQTVLDKERIIHELQQNASEKQTSVSDEQALREKVTQLTVELNEAQDQLRDEINTTEVLRGKLEEANGIAQASAGATEELQELREKVTTLESTLSAIMIKQRNEAEEYAKANQELQNLRQINSKLKSQIDDLQTKLEESREKQDSSSEEIEESSLQLKERISQLEKDQYVKVQEAQKLLQSIDDYKILLQQKDKELRTLQEENEALQESTRNKEENDSSVEDAGDAAHKHDEEKELMRDKMITLENDLEEYEARVSTLEASQKRKESQIEELQQALKTLQTASTTTKNNDDSSNDGEDDDVSKTEVITKLREEKTSLEQQLSELKLKYEELAAKPAPAQVAAPPEETDKSTINSDAELAEYMMKVEDLNSQIRSHDKVLRVKDEKISKLENTVDDLEKAIKDMSAIKMELVEHKALADRLGLKYPFPDKLVGSAKLTLSRIQEL